MEPTKKYYTMGEYVHDHQPARVDMAIEESDIIRSEALSIAADKSVNVRFKKRYKSGPRNGKSALMLPLWVWKEAFDKNPKP